MLHYTKFQAHIYLFQGLAGTCCFFLRNDTSSAVTESNIESETTLMVLDCTGGKLLQAVEKTLRRVMIPALKSQKVSNSLEKPHQIITAIFGLFK